MLEEFLWGRSRGQRREDLFAGLPWFDDDNRCHEFRLPDLMRWLGANGMRDAQRGVVTQWIKKLGGGQVGGENGTMAKGKRVHPWFVPENVVSPFPEMDAVKFKDDPV